MTVTATEAPAATQETPTIRHSSGGSDRRRYSRFNAPKVIASGEWERVIDISFGGVCLEGRGTPAPGDQITVIMTDEVLFHTAMIEAEVVWRANQRVGLRWLDVDQAGESWLQERCRNGGRVVAHGWMAPG
jgi:hypothetical protein